MDDTRPTKKQIIKDYNEQCFWFEQFQREMIILLNVDVRVLSDEEFRLYKINLMEKNAYHDISMHELRSLWKANKQVIKYKFPTLKTKRK